MSEQQKMGDQPHVIGPDGGIVLDAGPVRTTLKVTSDHSEKFTLLDYQVPPGFTAPPVLHHHTREDWAAHITDGELTFVLPSGEVAAPAGSTVFVPAHTDFAWRNDRDQPARFLAIHAPAGFDRFFVDVCEGIASHGGTPTPEVMRQVIPPLWGRYGIEPQSR